MLITGKNKMTVLKKTVESLFFPAPGASEVPVCLKQSIDLFYDNCYNYFVFLICFMKL